MSGADGYFPLGQFTGDRFFNRCPGVAASGYPHGLINVGTTGKRIADRSADTGCGSAERFDFRRVIMGFILKHHEPVFIFSVYIYRYHNTAGIDLFRFIQIFQFSLQFQFLHGQCSHIHQG